MYGHYRCMVHTLHTRRAPAGKRTSHLDVGQAGEEEAARFLAARKFSFLARNWRPQGQARHLELDIIGSEDDTVVFVEVKSRDCSTPETAASSDSPPVLANFSPAKRVKMLRAARFFLSEYSLWGKPCRFDLICVTFMADAAPQLEYYRDVIELGQTLDSSNASWQPW